MLFLQQNYMGAATDSQAEHPGHAVCWQPSLQPNQPTNPMAPYLLVRGCWTGDSTSGATAPTARQSARRLPAVDRYRHLRGDERQAAELPVRVCPTSISRRCRTRDKASRYVARYMTSDEWNTFFNYFVSSPNSIRTFYMEFYGGAINSQPTDYNAFVHRTALYNAVARCVLVHQ